MASAATLVDPSSVSYLLLQDLALAACHEDAFDQGLTNDTCEDHVGEPFFVGGCNLSYNDECWEPAPGETGDGGDDGTSEIGADPFSPRGPDAFE